jgi:hypothetical protein
MHAKAARNFNYYLKDAEFYHPRTRFRIKIQYLVLIKKGQLIKIHIPFWLADFERKNFWFLWFTCIRNILKDWIMDTKSDPQLNPDSDPVQYGQDTVSNYKEEQFNFATRGLQINLHS